jgi:hypothetical protein
MSRPRKQEVDYFPHYCDHGKVLFILENRFGNDGYAVFYKIEELLAKTNGHCYDCSTPESWEYLLSRMNTPEDQVVAIIDKLVSMGTIDRELWDRRLIWMQTFVDSIADAYSRRKVDLPSKPDNPPQTAPLTREDVDTKPVKPVICQHLSAKESKVNKSKVKESISRKPKTPLPEDFKISPAVYQWAKNKGHTRLDEHLESFKAKCRANGYQYIDWDSAFMEAVRSDWAKLKPAGGGNGRTNGNFSDDKRVPVQDQIDADLARANAAYAAAKAAAARRAGGAARDDDAPDFQGG